MSAKIRKKWKSPKHYPLFSPAGGSFPFLSGAADEGEPREDGIDSCVCLHVKLCKPRGNKKEELTVAVNSLFLGRAHMGERPYIVLHRAHTGERPYN